jgi:hypothetical protein
LRSAYIFSAGSNACLSRLSVLRVRYYRSIIVSAQRKKDERRCHSEGMMGNFMENLLAYG